jgi:hypothetical protein
VQGKAVLRALFGASRPPGLRLAVDPAEVEVLPLDSINMLKQLLVYTDGVLV